MTNITSTARFKSYTGNGTAGPFDFSFQVNAYTEVKVYVDTTLKTAGSHYNVENSSSESSKINTDGTGRVRFTSSNFPTSSQKITIVSNVPLSRTSVYTTSGPLTASALETDFDTSLMHHQQISTRIDRTIGAPESDPDTISMTLPSASDRANRFMKFDASGDVTTTLTPSDLGIGASIIFEGATANDYETTLTVTDPTADRTWTIPDVTDTFVGLAATQTLTNKTLTTPVITEIDSGSTITLDATTDIVLDADGGDIFFKDAGTTFGSATNSSGNLIIKSGTTTGLTFSGANVTSGGDLTVTGDLTVNGDTVTVNTATLSVEDPLIILAKSNNSSDSVDIGFYGLYDTSGSQDLYAGLFRDAGDGKWKLFKDLQEAPTTTVNTSGTGYAVGTLVANLEGDVTGTLQTASQTNITGVGTISTGTWQGTAIADTYVANDLTISGGTINNSAIGASTPNTGAFTSLQVDYINSNASTLTITDSSDTGDKLEIAVGTHGATTITTTDDDAEAANIVITADGTAELAGTTVTLNSGGGITLDADSGTITFSDGGSGLGTITSSGYSGTAAVATAVTVADESSDTSCNVLFTTAATGDLAPKSGTNLTFNSSSGVLTATGFAGDITGNVTGNTSGTAATVTGAAQTNITSVGTLTSLTTSGDIELGHASDTTIARSAAGVVTIEGKKILTDSNTTSGVLLAKTTISDGDATISFNSTYITDSYNTYDLYIQDLKLDTDSANAVAQMRFGTADAADSDSDYSWINSFMSTASDDSLDSISHSDNEATSMVLTPWHSQFYWGGGTGEKGNMHIRLHKLRSTTAYKGLEVLSANYMTTSGSMATVSYGEGFYHNHYDTAVNYVEFFMANSDFESGTVSLYGYNI